ncbi:MAG: hypothetical protein IKE03_03690 [Blautia sp.]|nr:hypothetical protein [Blautia sp.]
MLTLDITGLREAAADMDRLTRSLRSEAEKLYQMDADLKRCAYMTDQKVPADAECIHELEELGYRLGQLRKVLELVCDEGSRTQKDVLDCVRAAADRGAGYWTEMDGTMLENMRRRMDLTGIVIRVEGEENGRSAG